MIFDRRRFLGLAGLGTVGASVWRRLDSQRDLLRQRTGTEIRIGQVAVMQMDGYTRLVGIGVDMVQPLGIEGRRSADDSMHVVILG